MNTIPGLVLGIESSCDETAVAVLEGRAIRSSVISSQVDLHAQWGGVVPEAAARAHVEAILPCVETALREAGASLADVAAIAVTNRPGLVGALSVGATAAKALSRTLRVPVLGVHHLEGHLVSPWLVRAGAEPAPVEFPLLALIVSGGHTELVHSTSLLEWKLLGATRDDAAGEAFDKTARQMGLPSPSGRAVQDAAALAGQTRYPLPRALPDDPFAFSFSGLKTAVRRLLETRSDLDTACLAASLQEAIVDSLVSKTIAAGESLGVKVVSIVGGVAANSLLRETLSAQCSKRGWTFLCPNLLDCTDNAAMIALAGSLRLARGERSDAAMDVFPNAELP